MCQLAAFGNKFNGDKNMLQAWNIQLTGKLKNRIFAISTCTNISDIVISCIALHSERKQNGEALTRGNY